MKRMQSQITERFDDDLLNHTNKSPAASELSGLEQAVAA